MSPAAGALLRALIGRTPIARDRILLTDVHSTDWQSLTFTGERHEIGLRIAGPDSLEAARRFSSGLEHAEFSISGLLVADIGLIGSPLRSADGAIELRIEALTIVDD